MKISIRTTHFAIAAVANVTIAAIIGICMRWAWTYGSNLTLGITIFLFLGSCLLNLYTWVLIMWYILRPAESVIDILFKALRNQPPDAGQPSMSYSQIGKLSYILNTMRNNAEQIEQAAKELKEQKDYLQTILETIPDAIVTIDNSGKIQMINSATEKTFGFSRTELVSQQVSILLTPPDKEKYGQSIDRYLQEGCSAILKEMREMEAKHKDGTAFPIEIWVSALHYNSHPVCLGVIRDISERKKAEAEHAHYLHDLESSNRELDDFAYIVSHDLKEPLRGLQSFSNILLEDYGEKLDEEGKDKLHTISDLTKNMEKLLDTLLYYSRLGKTALAIHETNLDDVVRKVVDSFSISLKEKNTTIEIVGKLPVVVCDHVRIAEVFQNLISNAVKYTDDKENKIEIGIVEDHPRKPGETVFYVRDHGIGIPEKHLETVFKIFKRLHPRNAYGGGTGSGLAIVKKIITQHGGEIWAESKGEGNGTTFFFTIPRQNEEQISQPVLMPVKTPPAHMLYT